MLDSQGLEVSTDSAQTIATIDRFGEAFLGYTQDAPAILEGIEADPDSVLARTLGAALFLFGEARQGRAEARAHLDAAAAGSRRANERERRLLDAVEAWFVGDYETSVTAHEDIAARWPTDLVSAKLGQYHAFNRGDSQRMARLALSVLAANNERAYAHGMAAFGFEQTHELVRAEAEGRLASQMSDHEPWANHAVAHCLDAGGRLDEAVEWMHGLAPTWEGCNSFMYTHNWWHTALFHLDRDETAVGLAIYDEHLWPIVPEYSQDQIGAISMLARLEMRGVDVGDRWQAVAPYLEVRVDDQVEPFLDLHYLYGLARSGQDVLADRLLGNIETHARSATGFVRVDWAEVALPAAKAMVAHARGQWDVAAAGLAPVLPEIYRIGGSHAQRDLFELLWLDAMYRAQEYSSASALLEDRIRVRTSIPWHHQMLADCLAKQGETGRAEVTLVAARDRAAALTPWAAEGGS